MRRGSPVSSRIDQSRTTHEAAAAAAAVASSSRPAHAHAHAHEEEEESYPPHYDVHHRRRDRRVQQRHNHGNSRSSTRKHLSNATTTTTTSATNASSISSMTYSNSASHQPSASSCHNHATIDYGENIKNNMHGRRRRERNPSPTFSSSFAAQRSVETFLRKSAIQDVIKAFQCKQPTHLSGTTLNAFSKTTTAGKRRSDRYTQDGLGSKKVLDNSLLEEEGVPQQEDDDNDIRPSAFHPFSEMDSFTHTYKKNMNHDDSYDSGFQQWNGWFAKPVLDACRGRFQEEGEFEDERGMGSSSEWKQSPMSCLDRSSSSVRNKRQTGVYYRGEDDDAFLKLKGSWNDKDVNQVFRPRVHVKPGDMEEEEYENGGGNQGEFQEDGTWNGNIQDWTFQKVALKQGKESSSRLLEPSPRDSDPWRQSPLRRREYMEKHHQGRKMGWEVQGGGQPLTNLTSDAQHSTTLDNGEHDHRGNHNVWGEDKMYNQECHNSRISTMGSNEGRRRREKHQKNNNLLDESLSLEESSPRSAKKNVYNTPGTEQTAASTPAESNPTTLLSLPSSVLHDNGMEHKQGLTDVRLKLFQEQSPSLELAQVAQGENRDERLEQGHIQGMKDAQSPLRVSGPLIKDVITNNIEQNDEDGDGKRDMKKQSQVTLKEENDFLRRQLMRYKTLLLENEKISKNEPYKSETSSTISSESGSSKTTSTMFSQSEGIRMKAQIVSLKANLSEKEAELEKVKEVYEQIDLSQKAQIQQLRGKLKNYKSKAEYGVLEAQMSAMQKSVDLYKDQLEESEDYIKELEKTIDQQLQMWQEEEEAFNKEVEALREQSKENAKYKERCGSNQSEIEKLTEELIFAKQEIKELRSTKDTLENNLRSTDMKRLAKESSEQYEETIRILQEEKDELERELVEVKSNMDNLRDQSMSVEFENKTEIKKLKEQLNHAAFRVQVMRNESPKRKRQEGSNVDSEESTVAQMMEQLKEADRKTEEAWASKKKAEESLIALKTKEEENTQKLHAEIEALNRKLSEARSRSRRIAVKSEEELSKIRESERELRRKASIYEEQSSELRQRLTKLQHQYSDELSSRKRIESALRNEISLLRQNKVSSSSNTVLPNSVNLNSNRVGKELKNLIDACLTLQSSVEPISKAKQKIGKDMLGKVVTNVDDLASIVRKIEVAAEEDKLQIENAFSIYDSAVTGYEKQVVSLQKNIKVCKEELATCNQKRLEGVKELKQTETDLQAKLNSLKVQLVTVQKEYQQYKDKMEPKNDTTVPSDLPADETQTIKQQSETTKAKMRKIQVSTGISNGDIELNLGATEESIAVSILSNHDDLISKWRSMDDSTEIKTCCNDKEEAGRQSIDASQFSYDLSIPSKSNASGFQSNDHSENEISPTNQDALSHCSDQTSRSMSHEKDESWQSSSDFSRLNELSNGSAKKIYHGAENDSSSIPQYRSLGDSTQVDVDTSLDSQHDNDNICYDDTTQASV
jgi:Chromosome segregation ATPases